MRLEGRVSGVWTTPSSRENWSLLNLQSKIIGNRPRIPTQTLTLRKRIWSAYEALYYNGIFIQPGVWTIHGEISQGSNASGGNAHKAKHNVLLLV